jgi:site-specific DNA-methyltransferase (cytosine-N4-specific)
MLCREINFHLAQEFYWWNPSKLPTPAEWVNVRRIRVKDAVNSVYWLSKTPWPKASNRRILVPYSDSMIDLLENGYDAKLRPSGHDISNNFSINNGAAIPPNLLAIPNTESNSYYLKYCKKHNLVIHPARFPSTLPEFFIRMLTDVGDMVYDPFAGSCIVGAVSERLRRKWVCSEMEHQYTLGALGRFDVNGSVEPENSPNISYKINHPACLWDVNDNSPLAADGGLTRKITPHDPKVSVYEKKDENISQMRFAENSGEESK